MRRTSLVALSAALLAAALGGAGAQKVTLDFWVPGAATERPYYDKLIAAFEKANPNIAVKLQVFPGQQYFNALNLSFRSGEQPDVLRVAPFGNLPLGVQVEQGWLLPLDPYLTPAVRQRYSSNWFLEGATMFGGKVYSLPFKRPDVTPVLLAYNKDLFKAAGLTRAPRTWDELRSYAKKLTETGKGRSFGMGFQAVADPGPYAGFLATTAGFVGQAGTALNYKTGQYDADHPAMVAAVDLLRKMNVEDRSVIPGWEGMDHNALADNFAQGRLGMFFAQDWMPAAFLGRYGLKASTLGLAPLPTPDGTFKASRVPAGTPQGFYGIAAKTQHPREAWALLNFLYGTAGNEIALAEGQSIYPAARIPTATINRLAPTAPQLLAISKVQNVIIPQPQLLPGWSVVQANLKPPTPNLAKIQGAAIQGQLDYKEATQAYNKTFNANLDAAIAAARQEGAKVCREQLRAFARYDGLTNFAPVGYRTAPTCK